MVLGVHGLLDERLVDPHAVDLDPILVLEHHIRRAFLAGHEQVRADGYFRRLEDLVDPAPVHQHVALALEVVHAEGLAELHVRDGLVNLHPRASLSAASLGKRVEFFGGNGLGACREAVGEPAQEAVAQRPVLDRLVQRHLVGPDDELELRQRSACDERLQALQDLLHRLAAGLFFHRTYADADGGSLRVRRRAAGRSVHRRQLRVLALGRRAPGACAGSRQ